MRFYVSGGMTGWEDNNEAAFDHAATFLRGLGHDVTTPVELDRHDGNELGGDGWNASDEEYEGFLDRDLELVSARNFDAVVFVRGWSFSGGAGREGRKAIQESLRLFVFMERARHGWDLVEVTPDWFLSNSRPERLRQEELA